MTLVIAHFIVRNTLIKATERFGMDALNWLKNQGQVNENLDIL